MTKQSVSMIVEKFNQKHPALNAMLDFYIAVAGNNFNSFAMGARAGHLDSLSAEQKEMLSIIVSEAETLLGVIKTHYADILNGQLVVDAGDDSQAESNTQHREALAAIEGLQKYYRGRVAADGPNAQREYRKLRRCNDIMTMLNEPHMEAAHVEFYIEALWMAFTEEVNVNELSFKETDAHPLMIAMDKLGSFIAPERLGELYDRLQREERQVA